MNKVNEYSSTPVLYKVLLVIYFSINYSKTQQLKTTVNIISHSFCGSRIWEPLKWMIPAHEVTFIMSAGAALIWRLDWGWRTYFHSGLLTWLLAEGLSSLPDGLLQRPGRVSLEHGSWRPSRATELRVRGKLQHFVTSSQGHILSSLLHSVCYKRVTKYGLHSRAGELVSTFWMEEY